MTIREGARGVGFAVLVAFVSGCASATLKLRDGSVVKRKIVRSSARTVWVEGIATNERDEAAGRYVVVEREHGEKFFGRFDAERSSVEPQEYVVADAWRQVCIEREEDTAERPFCVRGPDVEVTELAIARSEIVSVSHPGSTELGVGIGLFFVSLLFEYGWRECKSREHHRAEQADAEVDDGCEYLLIPSAGFGISGVLLTMDGASTYYGSRARYAPPKTSALPSPKQGAKGIRVGFEF